MHWTRLAGIPLLLVLACGFEDGALEDCDDLCDVGADPEPFYRVCYPGDGERVCLTAYALERIAPLDYPDNPPNGPVDGNYRSPVAYLDVDEVYAEYGRDVKLSPDFRLDEIAAGWRCDEASPGRRAQLGCRWSIVQVHMIERLQQLRDALGPIEITSGFRSPAYNASAGPGAATHSRHMFGDAVDFNPVNVSLSAARRKCEELGAYYINLYSSHIHCDWRQLEVDRRFFGNHFTPLAASAPDSELRVESPYSARIATQGDHLELVHEGFDEGEPVIQWHAYDDGGAVIRTGRGAVFRPPPGARKVQAVTAGWLTTSLEL